MLNNNTIVFVILNNNIVNYYVNTAVTRLQMTSLLESIVMYSQYALNLQLRNIVLLI